MRRIYFIGIILVSIIPAMLWADSPSRLEIQEIPGMEQVRQKLPVNIGEYNGRGFVEYIDESRIVINDTSFDLSSGFVITNLKGNRLTKKITKGMYVYYFLNSENRMTKIVVEE